LWSTKPAGVTRISAFSPREANAIRDLRSDLPFIGKHGFGGRA
jgi:hypothetical protein